MKNQSPVIWSSRSDCYHSLIEGLEYVQSEKPAGLLIMACSDNNLDTASVKESLSQCSVPVCGGVFPQLIIEEEIYDTGFILIGLPFAIRVYNYCHLNDYSNNTAKALKKNRKGITQFQNFLIFADAQCDNNEDFIHDFYEHIGSEATVIGGGAGSLEFTPKPCIFTNDGLVEDAVQIVGMSGELARNIGHGWEVSDGPYLVTSAQGHRVDTLDYQPAFQVYQKAIERLSGELINQENFFDIAKSFPLGIVNPNGDVLVRDPITTNSAHLECVGNIPVNTTINILRGDNKKLLSSSTYLANSFPSIKQSKMLLLFDCISRILYLQDEFKDELSELKKIDTKLPMIGALSMGEITNSYHGSIDLLNKSTVVGML